MVLSDYAIIIQFSFRCRNLVWNFVVVVEVTSEISRRLVGFEQKKIEKYYA